MVRILVAAEVTFRDSFRKSRGVGCYRGQGESHPHIGKEGTCHLRTMMVQNEYLPTAFETAVDCKGALLDGLQKSIATSP
jgi:hypothetical protein